MHDITLVLIKIEDMLEGTRALLRTCRGGEMVKEKQTKKWKGKLEGKNKK
jgi:hypothetical protein